jgi:hypothetical protein
MNTRTVTSAVLVGLLWISAVADGQEPPSPSIQSPPVRKELAGAPELLAEPGGGYAGALQPSATSPPSPSGLSDWILYRRPDCCSSSPLPPVYGEGYLRVGPSIPVGGNYIGRNLLVGWTIEGGVRALFFNAPMTRAWVVDAHIINSNNSGVADGDPRVLKIFEKNAAGTSTLTDVSATVRNFNRTLVGLGAGWESYLWGAANAPGWAWRAGADGGGRYGTASMTFNETRHRTDVIAGLYAAAHTDLEVPCGCCFLSWGLRCEWAYTWGDILQRQSDVQEINVLVTFGVRY